MTARLSVVRQPRNATAGCPKTPEKDGMPSVSRSWESAGEDPVVIHAMRLRPKFYPLIRQG
jgi:hypothetical protein